MKMLWSDTVWRLVKAEIRYNRFLHIMLFLTLILSYNLFANMARAELDLGAALPHVLTIAIMYLLFTNQFTEKRIRFIAGLPVSQRERGLAKLYSQILYWLGALLLYSLAMGMSFPDDFWREGVYRILALNALLITANAAFCISIDLWTDSQMPTFAKTLLLGVLWVFVLKLGITFFDGDINELLSPGADLHAIFFFYKTPFGVLIQHGIAVAFTILSLKIYQDRQSFTS
jgi:hypothetical protein